MVLTGKQLTKTYPLKSTGLFKKESLTAVNQVDISIKEGMTLGLVGESGSGKSTLGELLGGLQRQDSGHVFYEGKDIATMTKQEYQEYRKNVQFIFQNPQGSMNPYYKIKDVLLEPMATLNEQFHEEQAMTEIRDMLHHIGLDGSYLDKYPSRLSGGQSQRVAIARALLLNPKVIICDECVSALDVSVQAQILNILKDMQARFGMSYLFISHDIATVKYMSDEITVMYRGDVVEHATALEVLERPKHAYTQKLLKFVNLKNS